MSFNSETHVDLGLEIAKRYSRRGYAMPSTLIATFCGCSSQYIKIVERRALQKLRSPQHMRKLTD